MRSMINTNTTKLHTAKNSNGNSLPQGSPGNIEDLAMPRDFQKGETPQGAQVQEEGEIAQPKKRWWHFGRGKQDQSAQPIPASVAAQEPSVAPVEPAPQVEQQIQPKLTVEEIRKGLEDKINILEPEMRRLEDEYKSLKNQESEILDTIEGLVDKEEPSPEDVAKLNQFSRKNHAIKVKIQKTVKQMEKASVSLVEAETTLEGLPERGSVVDVVAGEILGLAKEADKVIGAASYDEQVSNADVEEMNKRREEREASQKTPPVLETSHDPMREQMTKSSIDEVKARKAQKQAREALNAAGGKQSGVAH